MTDLGILNINNNPIESSVLGVLLIPGLKKFEMDNNLNVEKILNKYLPNTRGKEAVVDCQNELIDAGLDDFAQL